MAVCLRAGVELVPRGDGLELLDHATGFVFSVTGPAGPLSEGSELAGLLSSLGLLDEGLSPEEIRARQRAARRQAHAEERLERLRELLAFARERVPYYRARAEVYDPARLVDEVGLRQLPLLRKADVRAHFPDGLLVDGLDVPAGIAEGRLELAATSGTTGERLQVVSDLELDSVPPEYEGMWGLPPSEETPRTAVFTSPTCLGTQCHLGKAPFEQRLRADTTLFLNSTEDLFSLRRDLLDNIAEELHRFQPELLLVNPVYLHWLARRAREWGVRLPPVKRVLSCYQYLSRLQRRAIEQMLGAPVYSYYFATDLAGCRMGLECQEGRLHVREDHCLVELLGPEGPVRDGQLGAVAVTALANRVMPLIRYLVGDIARADGGECGCPVSHWPALELHGRAKDMLRLRDRWVTTREVDEALADAPGVDFYCCLQVAPEELHLKAIPAPDASPSRAELADRLRERLGARRVRVDLVARLDPEPSLKFRLTGSLSASPPELP